MNLKLNLNAGTVKRFARRLVASTPIITLLAVAGLLTYTAWQVRQVLNLEPNPKVVAAEREKANKTIVRFDLPTLNAISSLNQVSGKVDLSNVGKSDPFSPN